MEKTLKYFFIYSFTLLLFPALGQYSMGGGISTLHGAAIDITRVGIHGYFESPRTEVNTFYIRPTYLFPHKYSSTTSVDAKPGVSVVPAKLSDVRVIDKTSYFSVDGGTRIYFINTYDAGFSLYGGGHLKGIISSYSREFIVSPDENVDPNNYQIQDIGPTPSLLFSFGGNFGAKYQLPYRGALTFDIAIDLISVLYDPYKILGQEISPLSLSLNLGYRFDWY